MQVITPLTIDLTEKHALKVIDAKQNDNARMIEVALLDNGTPWPIPVGTSAILRAGKPDRTGTFYDVTIADNKVMCELKEQTLSVPGMVGVEVNLYNAAQEKLTSFTFAVDVQPSVIADSEIISSDYFNALTNTAAQILATQTAVKPLGFYDTLEELEEAITTPSIGDMYGVGIGAPYDYYVYDGTQWVNNGQIGASGISYLGKSTGTADALVLDYSGVIGNGQPFVFTPNVDANANATLQIGSDSALPILNHDGTGIESGMLYADVPIVTLYRAASTGVSAAYVVTLDGKSGDAGVVYIPSVSAAGIISWTNEGGLPNPDPVNIKGPQGDAGADGVTFTPSVSAAGVISWTNEGGLPNPDPVNIKGPQGDAGADGADGVDGVTFTPSVSAAGVISWTNDGGRENPESVNIKGPQGEQGPRGEAGAGFVVRGYFSTLSALEAAIISPNTGDAYGVGAAAPYDIYIWDGVNNEWVNNGPLQGAKGDTGPQGPAGPNRVTNTTSTNLNGILKGNGSTVTTATSGTDYATPAQVNAKYTKPSGGIPKTDLASAVRTSLGLADTAVQPAAISDMATQTWVGGQGFYEKPSGGIPKTDLASAVQTSLDKADSALQAAAISDMATQTWVTGRGYYVKPASGIPNSDIASASTWNNKQAKITATGILKGSGSSVSAATPVTDYGLSPEIDSVTLTSTWTGSASPYTQSVTIAGVTANSKVDLQPDSTVIAQMITDGTAALYIENNNGTLTAYAIGAAPTTALTIQVSVTEVIL